jgi:hypothetical protein
LFKLHPFLVFSLHILKLPPFLDLQFTALTGAKHSKQQMSVPHWFQTRVGESFACGGERQLLSAGHQANKAGCGDDDNIRASGERRPSKCQTLENRSSTQFISSPEQRRVFSPIFDLVRQFCMIIIKLSKERFYFRQMTAKLTKKTCLLYCMVNRDE